MKGLVRAVGRSFLLLLSLKQKQTFTAVRHPFEVVWILNLDQGKIRYVYYVPSI